MTATAAAAGLGAVISGVLPMPPGMPAGVVVAGDRASTPALGAQPSLPAQSSGTRATPTRTTPRSALPSPTTSLTSATATSTSSTAPASPTAAGSPSATTPATPQSPDQVAAAQAAILSLVNTQRAQHGCTALTAAPPLTALAQSFSTEMATRGFFGHTDPDHRTPWDRARALGITNLGGENIARGQQTAQDVMDAWMHSPGHRANMLDCDYHSLGVGVYFGPGGPWWTQDFGF
ncbi:CAP domain-containing protein [Streptacidiphilus sp. MAP12-20]|uniref:CAP domain-containing protein n=1 Tax=Streptacidiphilus sp. MAP12-20 TaxID=3156299 RepID=UPI003517C373